MINQIIRTVYKKIEKNWYCINTLLYVIFFIKIQKNYFYDKNKSKPKVKVKKEFS